MVLVQGRYGDAFGGIRGGHWGGRVGFGGGRTTCAGGVCVLGTDFHQSRVWQISFWCSPIVCRAFGWWGLVSVCISAFGVGGLAVPWLAWALWG